MPEPLLTNASLDAMMAKIDLSKANIVRDLHKMAEEARTLAQMADALAEEFEEGDLG